MISRLLIAVIAASSSIMMMPTNAIDIKIDEVHCDNTLPIYALDNDIRMQCDDSPRCTFGETAQIIGTLYYESANNKGLMNTTGYATGSLKLMSMEFDLFQDIPVDFCGEWISNGHYNYNVCPGNGTYHFELPYTLPTHDDFQSWFATGWNGHGYLDIYSHPDSESVKLASCVLHVQTYTTQSQEKGWATMPSAAATTFSLVALIAFLLSCICCMACSKSKRSIVADGTPLIDQRQPEGEKV
mmetsp:Transcript_17619/g.48917  ORF Transcript_17619/g.48917 Transcript_17619/m.48917 type:complete len:242 (-) Transcript_17619:139-864(-)|eukprot:CAMPEP_0198116312 /NCGR_PEP_ID=MMETSP1442-20131203/11350_1 /TAXON_ID= /ORGANISM="Craspedostauros australis, Strain CCMP3328" /LENGTH=241 /DNA_ID=CAMNT_0043774097 /DNA_START=110 /DNA_END=835 /DNA_ORIENTATION=-